MSDNNSKYYKLASIVDNFLAEKDLPNGWWNKCLLWAIRGLREISLDSWQDVKTVLLTVTDRNTVELPSDFVDWVIVSRHTDKIVTLGINPNISYKRENTVHSTRDDAGFYLSNYKNGAIFSYGVGVASQGAFRVKDNGTCKELLIDLATSREEQVLLEYITDGFDPCGETIVHPYLYDYLTKYMDFKFEETNNPKANESSIYRKGQDVFWAEKRVRSRKNNLDPQTFLNLVRQHTTLALKI